MGSGEFHRPLVSILGSTLLFGALRNLPPPHPLTNFTGQDWPILPGAQGTDSLTLSLTPHALCQDILWASLSDYIHHYLDPRSHFLPGVIRGLLTGDPAFICFQISLVYTRWLGRAFADFSTMSHSRAHTLQELSFTLNVKGRQDLAPFPP